jgi:hypothetical protein
VNEPLPDRLVLGVVLQTIFTLLLVSWGKWVAKRQGDTRFWRFAAFAPWVSVVLLTAGAFISIALVFRAFNSTQSTYAGMKARVLAEGISDALNVGAFFLVPGYLFLFFAIGSFLVGTFRKPNAP